MIDLDTYEELMNDILPGLQMFVRDVDLAPECIGKYRPGMLVREKAFTDASRRVRGMVTRHRYAILSNHMADLSVFEQGTNWGLCAARPDSYFKVLDLYECRGRIQILLLHLPDDHRWELMEHVELSIEKELIETSRFRFEIKSALEPLPELAADDWLNRCRLPIGMDERGNLWPLDSREDLSAKPAIAPTIQLAALEPGLNATPEQKEALEKAKWYFKPKRGLANEFTFPGSLLGALDDASRIHIERKIVSCCNSGDSRFFDALEHIGTQDLLKVLAPDALKKHDEDFAVRGHILEKVFLNTHSIDVLLILLKMATSSEGGYYHLASAIEKTDWTSFDQEAEGFRLFMRGLMTFTVIRKVIIRRTFIYDMICKSNLKQKQFQLLTPQDLETLCQTDPWIDCTSRDPLIFFKCLERRERYRCTGEIGILCSLLRDSVICDAAYDVYSHMKQAGEISGETLKKLHEVCKFG